MESENTQGGGGVAGGPFLTHNLSCAYGLGKGHTMRFQPPGSDHEHPKMMGLCKLPDEEQYTRFRRLLVQP